MINGGAVVAADPNAIGGARTGEGSGKDSDAEAEATSAGRTDLTPITYSGARSVGRERRVRSQRIARGSLCRGRQSTGRKNSLRQGACEHSARQKAEQRYSSKIEVISLETVIGFSFFQFTQNLRDVISYI